MTTDLEDVTRALNDWDGNVMGTQILMFMSFPVFSSGAAFVTLAFPVGDEPPAWNPICYHQAWTSLFLTINIRSNAESLNDILSLGYRLVSTSDNGKIFGEDLSTDVYT